MEAVGRLAGGIAHDFNNLLAVITMQCGIMLHKLAPGDPMCQRVEEINEASNRAASLTQQLLAFSRQQVLQPKILDLNEVVSDMTKMLRRVIGEDIQLMISLDPQAGRVKVDSGQLGQVLMNLAVNARDAMPRGGILTIETSRVDSDEESLSRHLPAKPGPYARLTVTDTGTGMTPEVQKRIFEPFFTTKGISKGTGLGLSTAYGIIKQSEGHLLVSSQLGQGTTFKIFLPCVTESVKPEAGEDKHPDMPEGTERILLVEDEEMLRDITREILENLGYTVLVAADGAEALTLCEKQSCQFDLIITDVVMPRISGRELVDELRKVWPKQRVLYMSGYTDDAILRHGVLKEGANFIQKPYTPAALAQKLRESLDMSE
ncbi:MAG TPA: response regulator, partial [Pyrinomonadaceae bacterium]|nr:response regulator [Pyrinomonadaceae bacterium]